MFVITLTIYKLSEQYLIMVTQLVILYIDKYHCECYNEHIIDALLHSILI